MKKILNTIILTLSLVLFTSSMALANPQDRIFDDKPEVFYQRLVERMYDSDMPCTISKLQYEKQSNDEYLYSIKVSSKQEGKVTLVVSVNTDGYIQSLYCTGSALKQANLITELRIACMFAMDFTGNEMMCILNNTTDIDFSKGTASRSKIYQSTYSRTIHSLTITADTGAYLFSFSCREMPLSQH